MSPFDFESWHTLATTDPAQFEVKRKEALLDAVSSAPEHMRPELLALVERLLAPSDKPPLERAVGSFNELMASYGMLTRALSDLGRELGESKAVSEPDALSLMTRFEVIRPGA